MLFSIIIIAQKGARKIPAWEITDHRPWLFFGWATLSTLLPSSTVFLVFLPLLPWPIPIFFLPKLIIVVSCPLDRKHRNDPRVDKLSRRKEIGDFQKNPLLLFLRKKMNIKNIAECHWFGFTVPFSFHATFWDILRFSSRADKKDAANSFFFFPSSCVDVFQEICLIPNLPSFERGGPPAEHSKYRSCAKLHARHVTY